MRLAQAAKTAKFYLLFLADGVGTRGDGVEFLSRTAHGHVAQFEPLTLLSALAAVTERFGLVGTASSSFNEPFRIGSSPAGTRLAPRTAEVIFTAQQTFDEAIAFYADVKGQLATFGRDPNSLKIMPGVFPVVGRTESEAKEKFAAGADRPESRACARVGAGGWCRSVRLSARRPDPAAAGNQREQEPADADA
ncbi:hypothetical protein BamMEX5DRAFT_6229 [Burkholderia ambifaria MEX-5]|uniref:Luciferase-like domain-containing protein n=1 Tax=Burkholderia ambifaria MEX-5 TaxID=396597 RepID=B1TEL3_9BURK|nr:hypothetical protein BamMEX5DRAFT_6229 [Burkholderia ambifaria MEX-5]